MANFGWFMFLFDSFLDFLHLKAILDFLQQSQQAHTPWYEAFGRLDIVTQLNLLLPPLLPIFLVVEVVLMVLLLKTKQVFGIVKVPVMIHFFNLQAVRGISYFFTHVLMLVISLDIGSWCIKVLSPHALFQFPHTWWAFILGFVIWEFSHFIFHYTSHKVRFLWCFHAPHHAPEHMSLILIYSNTLIQGMYAQLVRVSIGTLLGLDIHLLLFCMAIDFSWGGLIHVEERLWKSGKTGWRFLDTLFLMPVHHRIHHSSDAEFIDTNYCNTLPIWDRLFGTYRDVPDGTKINYGLVRTVNSTSFIDAHFGDLYLLARDMWQADNWQDRILYPFMPPGWSPRNNVANLAKT